MTYPESIDFLFNLRMFGTKLGLDNTFALAEACGNPQRQLRFIHVAGTNGKGSTCAMLESVYRTSGLKVGLFTSPHLVSFTERIQVNRSPISEAEVAALTNSLLETIERLNGSRHREQWKFRPTFFEVVTIMALIHFARQQCDLVIWETGMGGRLDATNIVTPLASIITNIQLDHERWLGSTLAEIAREKAGIIKDRVPVITAARDPAAFAVIQASAATHQAPLHQAVESCLPPGLKLSLAGEHQRWNAACACKAVQVLDSVIPVHPETLRAGLEQAQWPGRLQQVRVGPTIFLLDGAHNPDGARTLGHALDQQFAGQQFALIIGLFKDKDWRLMCSLLVPHATHAILVPVQSERTVDPHEVLEYCRASGFTAALHSAGSLAEALSLARQFPFVVIAGSLHLVGEAMEKLGLSPGAGQERGLNEWDAGKQGSGV